MGLFDYGARTLLKARVLGPACKTSFPPTAHFLLCPDFIPPPAFPQPWFPAGAPEGSPIQLVPVHPRGLRASLDQDL